MTRIPKIAALVAMATACGQAETPEQAASRIERESAAARTAIAAQDARYSRFITAGLMDSALQIYTEDAAVLPPNEAPLRGHAAIADMLHGMASSGSFELTIDAEQVVANGPQAVESGRYTMAFTPGPDAPAGVTAAVDTGKFLAHWRREGDQWRMAHHMWSTNRPMGPEPPR